MKYKFQIDCDVVEDSWQEGELDRINHWDWEAVITMDDDIPLIDVIKHFIKNELYYSKEIEIGHLMVDEEKSNRFCYSFQLSSPEFITSNYISEIDKQDWIDGKIKLYMANFDIHVYREESVNLNIIEGIGAF